MPVRVGETLETCNALLDDHIIIKQEKSDGEEQVRDVSEFPTNIDIILDWDVKLNIPLVDEGFVVPLNQMQCLGHFGYCCIDSALEVASSGIGGEFSLPLMSFVSDLIEFSIFLYITLPNSNEYFKFIIRMKQ